LIIEGPGKQQTTFENQPIGPLAITMKRALFNVAERLEQAESHLTYLDSQAGDGDLGASMARGAQAIRQLPDYAWATPEILMIELGNALRQAIAGSSGPFYATALMRAGRSLKELSSPSVAQWELAFREAVLSVSEIGGAKAGDRTMMDALLPALSAFELSHSSFRAWVSIGVLNCSSSGTAAPSEIENRVVSAEYKKLVS
jgi:dihydroxyacetone kinase